jgi:hypothetical protein
MRQSSRIFLQAATIALLGFSPLLNDAHAKARYGDEMNAWCSSNNRVPATPYAPNAYFSGDNGCRLCHTTGSTGSWTQESNDARRSGNYGIFCTGVANQEPQGQILQPSGNVTIASGATVDFSGGGSDPDGDLPLTYHWDFDDGRTSGNKNPSIAFTNTTLSPQTYTVRLTVTDSKGLADSSPDTVNVTVNPANRAPVAADDTATTDQDVAATINVLANDSDVDGSLDPSTVTIGTSPGHGSTSVDPATGRVTYTPNPNFNGGDSFTYSVKDDDGEPSNAATVTVTVNRVNILPVANDDSATTDEDVPVTIDVLANDNDVDGNLDAATVQVASPPSHGSASVDSATGRVTYTPTANFSGPDGFTYTVKDNDGASSNTANVAITVNSINDLPVAQDDSATTNEDVAVTIDVLANDNDVDGNLDAATVQIATSPANGQATVDPATGQVTYTPAADYAGSDSFTYTVNDNDGASSNTATVNVTIIQQTDPPVAHDDSATTDEDGSVVIAVLTNDNDPDGTLDPATVAIGSSPANGQATVDPATGDVTYTPAADFNGSDSFTYTVKDDDGAVSNAATVTVTIIAVNDIPVAMDDGATTDQDVPVTIDVLANDNDVEGPLDPETVQVATAPGNGSAMVDSATGQVTYRPAADFFGEDTFTYTVKDGDGAVSSAATVSVTVSRVNRSPVAQDDGATTDEDVPVTIDVLANDEDTDGNLDPTTVTITTSPALGSATIDPATGQVTYQPEPNRSSSDSFTYTVEDDDGAVSNAATVTVAINAVNDLPVALDDTATTDQEVPVTIDVLANDSDVEGTLDPGSVLIATLPSHGSATVDPATGQVTYQPAADFFGEDSFLYSVSDGQDTATATVTVTVVPAPVAACADVDGDMFSVAGGVCGPVDCDDADPLVNTGAHEVCDDNVDNDCDGLYDGQDDECIPDDLKTACQALFHGPCRFSDDPGQGIPLSIGEAKWESGDGGKLVVKGRGAPGGATVEVANADTGEVVVTTVASSGGEWEIEEKGVGPGPCVVQAGVGGAFGDAVAVRNAPANCVGSVNAPPVADDDTATTQVGEAVTIDVLGNDDDPNGDPLTVVMVSQPAHGTATANSPVVYAPADGYTGEDSFTYTISDGSGGMATATVTVTITGSPVDIARAVWRVDRQRFVVRGENAPVGATVTVLNSATGAFVGTAIVGDDGKWRFRENNPSSVPCSVQAGIGGVFGDAKQVRNAPADCVDAGGTPGDHAPVIRGSDWRGYESALRVSGGYDYTPGTTVTVVNANTGAIIGTTTARDDGEFRFKAEGLQADEVPCRVKVEVGGLDSNVVDVEDAPAECDGNDAGTPGGTPLTINEAKWESGDGGKLVAKGKNAPGRATVQIANGTTGEVLATTVASGGGEWEIEKKGVGTAPCSIKAGVGGAFGGAVPVRNAPSSCIE